VQANWLVLAPLYVVLTATHPLTICSSSMPPFRLTFGMHKAGISAPMVRLRSILVVVAK
jgi:hypothetical protein